jgi:hypothetical protein
MFCIYNKEDRGNHVPKKPLKPDSTSTGGK